ncbi:HGxxPAAW family protein [Streptomyces litchfieldiae]|uniref:HGxxPAAW family protein n=1 Tax=Streptomyces litchfieldiae TaxID=3075543 RepID=A0ABU2N1F9_9ACTN|nr:HGxxPAAW family protein [Streptomyces sp. DSM 44938]MDT0347715.1 HGxxPAAW family protein [Streptomyces sp. DSM 44938]
MAGRHYHHGNSPAAWAAVIVVFIGFGIGGAYTIMAEPLGVLAGGVVTLLGGVVGLVMRSMGLGQAPAPAPVSRPAAASAAIPAQSTGETREPAVS